MQHRGRGRIGACLALVSSALVIALPVTALPVTALPVTALPVAAAAADESGPPGYGHFSVQLNGHEIPGGGNSDARGEARLDLDPEHETACFVITWRRIDGAVTAFHLHAGHRGSEGPRWIDFFDDKHFDGGRNSVSGCVHVEGGRGMSPRDKIEAVIHDPSSFYLNVHSTEFHDGAIRGQLG